MVSRMPMRPHISANTVAARLKLSICVSRVRYGAWPVLTCWSQQDERAAVCGDSLPTADDGGIHPKESVMAGEHASESSVAEVANGKKRNADCVRGHGLHGQPRVSTPSRGLSSGRHRACCTHHLALDAVQKHDLDDGEKGCGAPQVDDAERLEPAALEKVTRCVLSAQAQGIRQHRG